MNNTTTLYGTWTNNYSKQEIRNKSVTWLMQSLWIIKLLYYFSTLNMD